MPFYKFVAFTQGVVGKTLKMTLDIRHYLSSYQYKDPAGRDGNLSLNTYVDWELYYFPVVGGEWTNEYTLPLEMGEKTLVASGSHPIRAQEASDTTTVSVKVPSSRLGAFLLRPTFNASRKYIPYVSDAKLTNVSKGMKYDVYKGKIKKQSINYGVTLYASLRLDSASYS